MHEETHALSESQEMYLKSIHIIQQQKGAARVKDIAEELGVNKPSVTAALRNLSAIGLVNYRPYDLITLTESGVTTARDIIAKYSTLRDFFHKVLGVEGAVAEAEACQMEHRISEKVFDRLLRFVEYYDSCPHEKVHWNEVLQRFCTHDEENCRHCKLS